MKATYNKTRIVASAILIVFATCLLYSDDELTNVNSPTVARRAPASRTSQPAERPLHVEVPLVLVNVSAVGPKGGVVTGLHKDDFTVYDDGQPQHLLHFSNEDAPISVGLVFDYSGSMADKIDSARMAALEFIRTANPADEFCLFGFSDRPSKIGDCTEDASAVVRELSSLRAGGRTSLLDAVYLGLDEMRRARYPRQALLIFSDGGDNHSRYTEADLKRAAQESDTLIYALDIHGPILRNFANSRPLVPSREERLGPELMGNLAGMTGGRFFLIEDFKDLPDIAGKISRELRNIYTLGYTPGTEKRDGKWHKIQVKLANPPGSRSARVYAKSGYYATEP